MYRFYSKPEEGKQRVTIVAEFKDNTLNIAAARCSKKDRFIKRKGRAVAESRLKNNYFYRSLQLEKCDVKTFFEIAQKEASLIAQDARILKHYNRTKQLVS